MRVVREKKSLGTTGLDASIEGRNYQSIFMKYKYEKSCGFGGYRVCRRHLFDLVIPLPPSPKYFPLDRSKRLRVLTNACLGWPKGSPPSLAVSGITDNTLPTSLLGN